MNPSSPRIYLDNAATSFPKPPGVAEAVTDYMVNNGAAFGRGSYRDGEAASEIVTQCRQQVARLLSAQAREIAFTFNCTDSLNLLLRGLLQPNDRVVTSLLEHNSVLRPLNQLQQELTLDVDYLPFDPSSGLIDPDAFRQSLTARPTRLVVLNHASNVTGVIQPVKEVIEHAHAAGALVLLDAAQTTGHHEICLSDLKVDFLAAAGHKGLLGPLGTGIVFVRSGREERLSPVRCGGTGTQSESPQQPRDLPGLFESGNMNMPGLVGLNAGLQWLQSQDRPLLAKNVTSRAALLRSHLQDLAGVKLLTDGTQPNTGIVSFTIDGVDSREAATILDSSFGVQCRAGFHCAPLVHQHLKTAESGGSLRMSPGVFTTEDEIVAAAVAIEQLCDAFSIS